MLDIKLIRENPELIRESMHKRQMDPSQVDEVLRLDEKRRALILDVEVKRSERNSVSKEISRMKDPDERNIKIEAMRLLGDEISALDEKLRAAEQALTAAVAVIPNIPDDDVPIGVDDKDNIVIRQVGTPRSFDFEVKPHWDLGTALGIIDFEGGLSCLGRDFMYFLVLVPGCSEP